MIVIIGFIIVTGCVLGGFSMAGGHVGALWHPSEVVTIGGAALGAMVVMSPKKVLIDLMKACIASLKGSPFGKKSYEELFQAMYEVFRLVRRNGLLTLESHLADLHHSSIFGKYKTIANNHHVSEFIVGAFAPIMDGSATPERLAQMMEMQLKTMEDEHHHPISVLQKTADGLPGFGIVAAVLGIVITMGHINGPVEEIGHKVGAALVGTFLGILLSYGFFAPMCTKLEFMGHEEMGYFRTIAALVQGFVSDLPPKVCIEMARRGLTTDVRPTSEQMEALLKSVEQAGG
jgi:chemotaxis protein MotA